MSVCLIISVFCKSCEPICEPGIILLQYHFENLQKFHVQCSVHKSYKTWKWILSCIGNFEENMDLSRICSAVQGLIFSLILGDCEETVTTIEIDEETYEEVYRSTKRNIPMMYVRGDSVILVSPPSRSTN